MDVRAIHDEAEHQAALKQIEALWNAAKGTPEGDRLEVLILLTEAYEREAFRIPDPDPIKAIRIRAAEIGWTSKDLAAALGDRSKLSQVMNRDRRLSVTMIQNLAPLGLPAELLLQDTRRPQTKSAPRPPAAAKAPSPKKTFIRPKRKPVRSSATQSRPKSAVARVRRPAAPRATRKK